MGRACSSALGARQSIDFGGSTVRDLQYQCRGNSGCAKGIVSSTWTPLSESLYETARYIAQLNSTFLNNAYVSSHCLCRRCFQWRRLWGDGVGSIGASEITALTGSETCTAGAGYITNARGRDPYFLEATTRPLGQRRRRKSVAVKRSSSS